MPFWWKSFNKDKEQTKPQSNSGEAKEIDRTKLSSSLQANLEEIRKTTGHSTDILIREITFGQPESTRAAVIFTDGLVNKEIINEGIISTLFHGSEFVPSGSRNDLLKRMAHNILSVSNVEIVNDWDETYHYLLSGEAVVLIEGANEALIVSSRGGEKRAITEPETELAVRGPREGFTEILRTNTALIRRRIKNPNLWVETMTIGKVTQTDVALMYVKGIARDEILEEIRSRLKKIEIDSILESGYIEQLIEDKTFTTFPTLFHTERPDVATAEILEGKIAILVDGTPFVLIAPSVFIQFFQSTDDYYSRFDIATALRFLRVLVFFISLVGPAVYIAATTFHQEMIPTLLVITITAQREAVPFPAFVEATIMEVTFEILREAGLRLPRVIGQAVSIVGALVIGQAAVQAGLVSPAMVIVVSLTAIASFATPAFAIAISARIIRFIFMVMAATFGFYGIMIGMLIMIIHLCSLRSFGVPYMSPLAPLIPKNIGDTFFRLPLWAMKYRPEYISSSNQKRQGSNQGPELPAESVNSSKKGGGNNG
ncbi:spore germination protein [Heyndrickxia acidicola]|uniref:Spore germination protein n=1 Tax=Heyndrickxia acidicola TaxID=209389 RepID=A0ABU6MMJ3_9BACI|nr:spore germination protein [Heyndrickxia acidicola]MED1205916.1 spore germination protein [Heyndrickxia acidicola]